MHFFIACGLLAGCCDFAVHRSEESDGAVPIRIAVCLQYLEGMACPSAPTIFLRVQQPYYDDGDTTRHIVTPSINTVTPCADWMCYTTSKIPL